MADEGEKKACNSFEVKRNMFGRPFEKKCCCITYKELPHLRTWWQHFLPFPQNAVTGALRRAVSEDAAARYGSWPHLSGNCYRWFNSLADRTPSKHHPRVRGPHLDEMLSLPPVQCHYVFCKIRSLTISIGPWIHLSVTSLQPCFIQFANVKNLN